MHTLPFAFAVMVTTPLGALAALRLGTRYVVALGLLITGVALLWMSTLSSTPPYVGPIIGSMVVARRWLLVGQRPLGRGHDGHRCVPEQIGGGSGGNETTRELGGTMGVAVIGSVFASLFGPDIRQPSRHSSATVSAPRRLTCRAEFDAGGQAVGATLPRGLQVAPRPTKVTTAFMDGLHRGCLVGQRHRHGRGHRRVSLPARPGRRQRSLASRATDAPERCRLSDGPYFW